MSASFYFYDLETSSGNARGGRIMQFAGQRTDMDLKPIGEPDNLLVKLAGDILPDPYAILVHGITPQQANADGISEAELIKYFDEKVALPGTIFVGYNNLRFDDEFIRYGMYRSLFDPYEWHWRDQRSRWDLLDPIRMMRALRPEGLEWPFAADGKPTVSLESMSKVNGIEHANAHDALADIEALIELAKKFKTSQPKLFDYLLSMRDKKAAEDLIGPGQPFVYTSGKYSGEFLKTTIAVKLTNHPMRPGVVVYDLRQDPTELLRLTAPELARRWRSREPADRLPLKTLQYNRCPAIAPLSVLDKLTQQRLSFDIEACKSHAKILNDNPEFTKAIQEALKILDKQQQEMFGGGGDVDLGLYDGFWSETERRTLQSLRNKSPAEVIELAEKAGNPKISELSFRYVARNFPKSLSQSQQGEWEQRRADLLTKGGSKSALAQFSEKLEAVSKQATSEKQQYLLTELQLYVESILPYDFVND